MCYSHHLFLTILSLISEIFLLVKSRSRFWPGLWNYTLIAFILCLCGNCALDCGFRNSFIIQIESAILITTDKICCFLPLTDDLTSNNIRKTVRKRKKQCIFVLTKKSSLHPQTMLINHKTHIDFNTNN